MIAEQDHNIKIILLYAFFWVIPQHLNFMCHIQTLGNNPEESIQHLEHGKSLK